MWYSSTGRSTTFLRWERSWASWGRWRPDNPLHPTGAARQLSDSMTPTQPRRLNGVVQDGGPVLFHSQHRSTPFSVPPPGGVPNRLKAVLRTKTSALHQKRHGVPMIVAQLMASPFVGGPERQVLGLAQSLPEHYRSVFLSFSEGGRARPLLDEARRHGFEAIELQHNIGALRRAVAEVAAHLQRLRADVLCCSGYKPDLIGLLAARRVGVPVVSVSHGWTGATFKVRVNETLDRLVVRWMDRVVCVSEAQAVKVRRAGVASERVVVIRNAIGPDAFAAP